MRAWAPLNMMSQVTPHRPLFLFSGLSSLVEVAPTSLLGRVIRGHQFRKPIAYLSIQNGEINLTFTDKAEVISGELDEITIDKRIKITNVERHLHTLMIKVTLTTKHLLSFVFNFTTTYPLTQKKGVYMIPLSTITKTKTNKII